MMKQRIQIGNFADTFLPGFPVADSPLKPIGPGNPIGPLSPLEPFSPCNMQHAKILLFIFEMEIDASFQIY